MVFVPARFAKDAAIEAIDSGIELLKADNLEEMIRLKSDRLTAHAPRLLIHIGGAHANMGSDETLQGYILAPLAVLPEYQNKRVGSKLIEAGQQRLLKQGVQLLFVYGDPHYYGRFGFSTDDAALYTAPYALQYPFGWQALALIRGSGPESPVTITCVASLSDPQLW